MIKSKFILTALLVLNVYVYGISQSNGAVNFHLGASASTYYTSQETFYKRHNVRPNYYPTVGISYDFIGDKKSFLSTGLSFQRQGWRKEGKVLNPTGTSTLKTGEHTYVMDYLVADIAYKVPLNRFYLGVGSHLGYIIHNTFKANGVSTTVVIASLINPFYVPRLDFGINGRFGFNLSQRPKRNIALEIKYALGIRGLDRDSKDYFQNLFRNQLLAVSIVYGINK